MEKINSSSLDITPLLKNSDLSNITLLQSSSLDHLNETMRWVIIAEQKITIFLKKIFGG